VNTKSKKIHSKADRSISIDVIPGHFATNHSHVNYCVNMTDLKIRHRMAKAGAQLLAHDFHLTPVESIICLEGTEMIGAFMAEALSLDAMGVNEGMNLSVMTPETNSNNQLIFRENTQDMIAGKNILLLLASVSTGKTIRRSLECLDYYGGILSGICALFSAAPEMYGMQIHSLFTQNDMTDYKTYLPGRCEMCAKKQKVDAIVNSFGYSVIR